MPFGAEPRARHRPPDRLRRPRATTSTSSPPSSPSAPGPPSAAPTSCCSSTACRSCSSRPRRPCASAVSWVDGALQVHDDYEKFVPELFVCQRVQRRHRGQGAALRLRSHAVKNCGARGSAMDEATPQHHPLKSLKAVGREPAAPARGARHPRATSRSSPPTRRSAASRSSAATSSTRRPTRSSQRVLAGNPRKGLIWHFQGSGKSLLMVFAAQKLRLQPALRNPTVLIVVDRIDLDAQISATFHASDIPNLVKAETRDEAAAPADAGHAQDHHHHHLQVRRGRRRAQRPRQHRRPGGRGAPHAGRRPRHQDARGPAQRLPLRPDRHAHQPARPQHLLRLRRRRGRAAAT